MPGETRTILSMFGAGGGGGGGSAKRPATFDARGGRVSAGATRRRGDSGSSFGECPLCAKSFHPALLHAHVDQCFGVPDPPPAARAETKTETNTEAHEAISNAEADTDAAETGRADSSTGRADSSTGRSDASSPSDAAIATEPTPRGSGVFAALMRAQRGATCKRVFSTWIADGEWRWCLERGVAPGEEARSRGMGPARWSCAVRLKEKTSDGQPCATTLTLVTDVAPAGAAELSAVAAAARRGEAGEAPRVSRGSSNRAAEERAARKNRRGGESRGALPAEHLAEALRRLVVVPPRRRGHPSTPLACWLWRPTRKGTDSRRRRAGRWCATPRNSRRAR